MFITCLVETGPVVGDFLMPLKYFYHPLIMGTNFTQRCSELSLIELQLENWLWRKRFLYMSEVLNSTCNFAILAIISFGKGRCSSFEQTWIPFTQEWFELSSIEIGSEEDDFEMSSMYFPYHISLERHVVPQKIQRCAGLCNQYEPGTPMPTWLGCFGRCCCFYCKC